MLKANLHVKAGANICYLPICVSGAKATPFFSPVGFPGDRRTFTAAGRVLLTPMMVIAAR